MKKITLNIFRYVSSFFKSPDRITHKCVHLVCIRCALCVRFCYYIDYFRRHIFDVNLIQKKSTGIRSFNLWMSN